MMMLIMVRSRELSVNPTQSCIVVSWNVKQHFLIGENEKPQDDNQSQKVWIL